METDTLFGLLNADGTMQVESNDRELRILLKRSLVFDNDRAIERFYTIYYVKEGISWQKTLNVENYSSSEEFLDAIEKTSEFTIAVRDIRKQKRAMVGG